MTFTTVNTNEDAAEETKIVTTKFVLESCHGELNTMLSACPYLRKTQVTVYLSSEHKSIVEKYE